MDVFVTGGAGFIGSHLCDALISQGKQVRVLDNLSTGSKNNISHLEDKIQIFRGDIRDKNLVESLVEDCELILHMAASLGVENILNNPIDSISTNFYGSEVVLNAAVKYKKRILIASTSEIYGKNPKQPLLETDDRVIGPPQKLRWTYSDAKALEEAVAYSLYLSGALNVNTVRLFNTVGPRQTGKYGMVVPRFVKAALFDNPLEIYGNGSQTRVFCHVDDATSGILSVAETNKHNGEVFNIGGKGEITILNLAEMVIDKLNSKSKIIFKEYKNSYPIGYEDMQRRVPDISKIRSFLGWEPIKTIEEIISDVANYHSR